MTGKASPPSSLDQLEKAGANNATMSYSKQLDLISRDKSVTKEKWLAAVRALNTPNWIETCKPPIFMAVLSRDPPEVRAAAMEAALKEPGADPNEINHDLLEKVNRAGRVLHYCVVDDMYYYYNIDHEDDEYWGVWHNLPALEVLLRHGADPRLPGFNMGRLPPLQIARYRRDHLSPSQRPEMAPFLMKAVDMMEAAAKASDEQDARNKSWFTIEGWTNRIKAFGSFSGL